LVRTVRVRSTVNEWLILRTLCFFSTCNKHSRHAGIILNIGHKRACCEA
jgi:hypothetical protein